MDRQDKIYVAGHNGLVGAAVVRELGRRGYNNIITEKSRDLDLREQSAVRAFYDKRRPEYVFIAAAKVGGILANSSYPADFIYDNLMIEANLIHEAYRHDVKKLLFLGSTCIYPKMAPQPIKEEYLLSGSLEPTNEWYAVAKIAGIKLCQAYRKQHGCNYICAMPTNLYGPGDNFDLQSSHVLPALIRKFHEAKVAGQSQVVVWGTGTPRREFMHVDDCATACLFLMEKYNEGEITNLGVGDDITIRDLATIIKSVVEYQGDMIFDESKPDGTPRKLIDSSKLRGLGWNPAVQLNQGIRSTYEWYLSRNEQVHAV